MAHTEVHKFAIDPETGRLKIDPATGLAIATVTMVPLPADHREQGRIRAQAKKRERAATAIEQQRIQERRKLMSDDEMASATLKLASFANKRSRGSAQLTPAEQAEEASIEATMAKIDLLNERAAELRAAAENDPDDVLQTKPGQGGRRVDGTIRGQAGTWTSKFPT